MLCLSSRRAWSAQASFRWNTDAPQRLSRLPFRLDYQTDIPEGCCSFETYIHYFAKTFICIEHIMCFHSPPPFWPCAPSRDWIFEVGAVASTMLCKQTAWTREAIIREGFSVFSSVSPPLYSLRAELSRYSTLFSPPSVSLWGHMQPPFHAGGTLKFNVSAQQSCEDDGDNSSWPGLYL